MLEDRIGGIPWPSCAFSPAYSPWLPSSRSWPIVTPALNGTGPFTAHSVIGYWTELAPASLVATRANITALTFPWVWNPVLLSVLTAPMSVLFAGLAVVCGYFGRRREQMKVHVN